MLPFFPPFIPNLLQVAPFVLAFALLCARPLRRFPGAFYVFWTLAVLAVTWYDPIIAMMGDAAPAVALAWEQRVGSLATDLPVVDAVVQLVTSSYTGVCLYLVVMFAGALERTPWVKRLLSVRSELSVIGGIVIMAHVVRVVQLPFSFANPTFAEVWGHPAAEFMFAAAVVVGPLLTVCFVVPWITSFRGVRRRMAPATWKKVQRLAYPFMALLVTQGFLLALGHCMYGYPFDSMTVAMAFMSNPAGWLASFAQQVATIWLYAAIGVAYPVLRLRKHARDKARRAVACKAAGVCSEAADAAAAETEEALSRPSSADRPDRASSFPSVEVS